MQARIKESRIEYDDFEINIITTREEVEKIRAIWERMQWHPNSDIDYFLAVVNSLSDILWPHVILFSKNGHPEALAIGRLERRNIDITLGYKTLFKFKVTCLTIIHGGLLGNWAKDISHLLVTKLMDLLKRNKADIVWINLLRSDSQIYELTKKKPSFICRDHLMTPNMHYKLILPDSYELFLSNLSKSKRANLRNYSNRFNKKYGESITIKCFDQLHDIDVILNDTEAIACKTYHRGIGVGFFNDNETYQIYKIALNKQWLSAYIMYISGIPIAFWHGLHYGNTFFTGPTGFDPKYADDRPGTILLTKIIDEFCRDNKINSIDFGSGYAEYKRIYCNQSWIESSVFIYAPTLKSAIINLTKTSLSLSARLTEYILKKLNLTNKLKKIWRGQLAHGNKDNATNTE